MKNLKLISIIMFGALTGSVVSATTMDSETQNLVVERLEGIIAQMDSGDSSYLLSNTRLADLLAERARLRFMKEIEASCEGCKGSKADRLKALELYRLVLPKTKTSLRGPLLLQIAHLELMGSQTDKAIGIYKSIIDSKRPQYSEEVTVKAQVSLADIYFEKLKYKEAHALYEKASQSSLIKDKSQITYRISWCQFNTNQLEKAISNLEKLIFTPHLPPAMAIDSLRDLSVFYSRQKITQAQIHRYTQMCPLENKKELLLSFAAESSRVGQKQASSQIYEIYLQDPNLTVDEKTEAYLSLANTYYEQGKLERALDKFNEASNFCVSANKCSTYQKKMRHFVTELHRSKKSKYDLFLLRAYEIYIQAFITDTQMVILGAQVAGALYQNERASSLYSKAADHSPDMKLKEAALAGEIETAELSRRPSAKENAYEHYLKLLPQGSRSYEVRYQLAQLSYEQKQWKAAADKFHGLALEKTNHKDLKKKSADLSIDCLAIEKRDEDIEKWALEFSQEFPAQKKDFQILYRKAVTTQIVNIANKESASSIELQLMIQKSKNMNLQGAAEREKVLHYKNQFILALRAQDDSSLNTTVKNLMAMASIQFSEKENFLSQTVGYYEKKSDYSSAYNWAKMMKFSGLTKSEREIKLAALAEKAGLSAESHYRAALSYGLPTARATAETVLILYGLHQSASGLDVYIQSKKLAHEPAILFIKKQPFYKRQVRFEKRLSDHFINNRSDRDLQLSIKARLSLLKEADNYLAEAIRLKDFTAQIMTLTSIQKENERLVSELMATPVPKGLTAKEQNRYMTLLKQQTTPYALKSQLARHKLSLLWSRKISLQNLVASLARNHKAVRPLIVSEMRLLVERAPNVTVRQYLEDSLNHSNDMAENYEKSKIRETKVSFVSQKNREKSL